MLQDGLLKYAARDFAGARSSLQQVLREKPDDARALSLLVDTYMAQNQGPAATEKIRQLVQEQPKSLPVQMLWARWLIRDNQKVEATKGPGSHRGRQSKEYRAAAGLRRPGF